MAIENLQNHFNFKFLIFNFAFLAKLLPQFTQLKKEVTTVSYDFGVHPISGWKGNPVLPFRDQ
jgi:hypothetical protein